MGPGFPRAGSAPASGPSASAGAPQPAQPPTGAVGALPAVVLPKGGGAIRGIGEKFATNPATGTGSLSIPIATSPGRSGFGPELELSYDTGAGNGPFGFGWTLPLPAITRKTDKGLPRYLDAEESDVFILSGAEDLVPVLASDGSRFEDDTSAPGYVIHRYRPRVEGLFARIERWTRAGDGDVHWRSISRDNVLTVYGKDPRSRVADPGEPGRVFSWLICESRDDKGNAIVYDYRAENGDGIDLSQAHERNRGDRDDARRKANRYLASIRYGNRSMLLDNAGRRPRFLTATQVDNAGWMFEVVFDYDEGRYEQVELDPNVPEAEQHRYCLASALAGQPWAVRPDPFASHRACFEVMTYRRCRRIMLFHHVPDLPTGEPGYDGLVRVTAFDYADLGYTQPVTVENELAHQGSTRFASFIRSVSESGYALDVTKAPVVRGGVAYSTYLEKSLPPLEFEYSKATIRDEVLGLDAASLENLPAGIDGSAYQWVDLDGEGVSGVLTEQGGGWFYKPNLGDGRLGPLEVLAASPSLAALAGGRQQLLDLAGDGQLDLVALERATPGFYERTEAAGWAPFRAFRSLPDVAWADPNLRFVELGGDGHSDVLVAEDDGFSWHRSLAEEGFGPAATVRHPMDEERGPRLMFADGTESVYLADMCGDGLADIVRIRNGEVCYWPNLGYGRFGAKVTMDNAPWLDNPDQFEQGRIRLADIDGSGTSDVVYLGRDGVRLYFNQSGNRLSDARPLAQLPHVDDVVSVMTVDLMGNGTTCIVWSSPLPADGRQPLRYLDLMGGTKPHLLVKSVNNLGAETRVEYAPSTKFSLADRRAGRPWATRLPFPVHVVERVVTDDRISGNQFVTRFAYHHGYFDGIEREFRGFGMVEQWDTEEFAALAGGELPLATNVEAASHVPPVLTKTWFHTGVHDRAGALSRQLAAEYHGAPAPSDPNDEPAFEAFLQTLLPDTVYPSGLEPEDEREACRALKGSMLRQEVYALDGTAKQPHPYTVSEQNFTIRPLQDRRRNRHGVFLTSAREAITYHYEREPAHPRVGHSITLDVDSYGNVLESAALAYGRQAGTGLLPADRASQAQPLVTYTENGVTRDHDTDTEAIDRPNDYRAPLPCESRTYELTGLTLSTGADRFTFGAIRQAATAAVPLDYEQKPTAGRLERRLIEHVRTYYRRDDLTAPLPLRHLQPLALPYESYRLAFTPGLVAEVYGTRTSDAMFEDEARYVHTEGDANWWMPSGRVFYSPDPADSVVQELAHARRHFFLPHRYRGPFHTNAVPTESFVTYDFYDLLVEETRDALENRVTVGERSLDPSQPLVRRTHDYRALAPALVMDPNRNCSEVRFDALGMVVGTAVMGKPDENPRPGDRLGASFRADLTRAELDRFLASPKGPAAAALLRDATTRIVYDVTAYGRAAGPARRPPAVVATVARETHASEPVPAGGLRVQVSFSYSDSFGREIQQKIQAEPGPAPVRDATGRIIVGADGQPRMTSIDVSPRWVGSGWTVVNNKGNPVRQYEPFFTDTHRFEFDVRIGVSPVLFYDPLERVVAILHPDHTWEKIVFGAWRQETWDVNDTVLVADPKADGEAGDFFSRLADAEYLPTWYALRTEAANAAAFAARYPDATARTNEVGAAAKARIHAATPAVAHVDPLGRTFLMVAHDKFKYSDTPPAALPGEELHSTRIVLDIEGNRRVVRDALTKTVDALGHESVDDSGRVVMRCDYDMLGNQIHKASMEAGERWVLNDVAGRPLYAWDSRDQRFRTAYDALRRPTHSFVREGAGTEMTVERSTYGESRLDPEADNLRGELLEVRDQAGVVTSDLYDFKRNLLRSHRRLADLVDPQGTPTPAYRTTVDWNRAIQLGAETYSSRTRYDALNRPTQWIAPHSDRAGTTINAVQPRYNEANLLEQLHVWFDQAAEPAGELDPATAQLHAVTDVDYDAKGRRLRVEHGNGARTTYTYDPLTFRLARLVTRRAAALFPDDCPEPPPAGWPGCQVQDLRYTYDPVGNVTHIRDDAQQAVYFRNKRVEPSAEYTYDSVYRLIEASGREHLGQVGGPPIPHSYNDAPRTGLLQPGDGNVLGRYVERYVYDAAGNFLSMRHRGTDPDHPGWTRAYAYHEPSLLEPGKQSNRLTSTAVGGTTETYSAAGDGYDAHGNMLRMPHLQLMQWNHRDQLKLTQRQKVNGDDADGVAHQGERTWYVCDFTGERVRKVTELPTGQVKDERTYFGALELYRRNGGNPLVRETLHVMDDRQRVALVEARTQGTEPGVPARLVRYQLGNHLGSASLELGEQAQVISYEEYTPFGSTSYQAVRSQTDVSKRYRYTGKERDEESGLYCHGARYYAPWIARWVSADPAWLVDGVNLFAYARNSPLSRVDPSGTQSKQKEKEKPSKAAAPAAQQKKKADAPAKKKAETKKAAEGESLVDDEETPTPTVRIHIVSYAETGFKDFDETAKKALKEGVLAELGFLKEKGFEVEVDFEKAPDAARTMEDINVSLVEPDIAPEKLKGILRSYGVERSDKEVKDIIAGHLNKQHGLSVRDRGKPGAVLVAIGANARAIGNSTSLGAPDEQVAAARESMGTAVSRTVLHEIGHDLGLGHTRSKGGKEIMSTPPHIMDFKHIWAVTVTKDELLAQHFTPQEKARFVEGLKTRLKGAK
jgi:RHS repeat-associated protein